MIQRIKSSVLEKKYLTKDVLLLRFERPKDFLYEAGQFVNIRIEEEGKMRMKAYSILSNSKSETLDFCIKLVDDGFAGNKFKKCEVGDEFEIVGPFGQFKFLGKTKNHFFIGAGTGIAPLHSIIFDKVNEHFNFSLLMSYKKKEDVLFDLEFKELEKRDNFKYDVTLTRDDWNGLTGRVQSHLNISIDDTTFYICGLKELVLDTKDFLISKGVKPDFIQVERYS